MKARRSLLSSLLLPLLTAGALSACVSYEFVPPQTEAGLACVATCESTKSQCTAQAHAKAEAEARECRQTSAIVLAVCLASAKDKGQKDRCYEKADSCIEIPMTHQCEKEHRRCYAGCGGSVIKHKD